MCVHEKKKCVHELPHFSDYRLGCFHIDYTHMDAYAYGLLEQNLVWFIFMHTHAFLFGHIGWFLLVHMANGWCTEWLVRSVVRQTQRSSPCVSMLLPPPLSLALFLSPSLPLFSSGIPHPPSLYVLPYSLKNQPEEETFTLTENRLTLSNPEDRSKPGSQTGSGWPI